MQHTPSAVNQKRPARKWLLGVCAEAAAAWNISISWMRAVFMLCTLLSFGLFVIVYVLMRLSMSTIPKENPEAGKLANNQSEAAADRQFIEMLQQRLQKHHNRASDKGAYHHPISRHGC
ncbi:PspC domain-containing protein [Xylanibacillus composti]|uniref:Phage shock protein PspC N-terminal domain-containing protein n=1 Tax=Xylanibacillus composti TaxID=1572762 RepID=A0A8J4H187_9BACL|nr:PspC domain-containing protein [Xylanibacillus composti]MDT9725627.1 PspC domain-containing protein [Xylanibacillus composti]GIQ67720.1 hypothetical protein XYCOK13_05440 [Xylanibacillus composti]